ncbi:MAG: PIG-L deacetylase family protein [Terriglobales bacterium]
MLAAHADDEAVGCMGWLHACTAPIAVAFLTDGAPEAAYRPVQYRDRAAYRRMRRREARAVWSGFRPQARLCFSDIPDQLLAFQLPRAAAWLEKIVAAVQPELILAPAFEGGHMDHDAANLLAARVKRPRLQIWEYALYTCDHGGFAPQCFPGAPRWSQTLTPAAARAKRAALDLYVSQAETLRAFRSDREAIRPLGHHDYARPPLDGPCLYEMLGWPWPSGAIATKFQSFLTEAGNACAC